MNRSSLPLVAMTVLTLVAAAPAAGISGYPLPSSLTPAHTVSTTKSAKAVHTCQAGRTSNETSTKTGVTDPRKMPVVACEHPPRSSIQLPSLAKSTAANALTTMG